MSKCCGTNKNIKLLMILCCIIPIMMISIIYLQNKEINLLDNLSYLMILICPLAHLLIIPLMSGKHKDDSECH